MKLPTVVPVTFAIDPSAGDVVAFIDQMARSRYWTLATGEYGVGHLTVAPAVRLDEGPPFPVGATDAADWLRSKLASASSLPPPTDQTIYALFLPSGLLPVRGFHSEVKLTSGAIATFAVVLTDGALDDVTSLTSHELVEAATNPRPISDPAWADVDVDHRGWELLGSSGDFQVGTGGEIGDVCPALVAAGEGFLLSLPPTVPGASVSPMLPPPWSTSSVLFPGIDHQVQRVWSNRAAAALHDPCVPFGMSPYFNTAAVGLDTVVATDSAGNSFETLGVSLPVGPTRAVHLHLFSDAPTAPWTVDVSDRTQYPAVVCDTSACAAGDPGASYFLDKDQGKDGDVIHLELRLRTPVPGGTHLLVVTSTLGNARTAWPLVVVE